MSLLGIPGKGLLSIVVFLCSFILVSGWGFLSLLSGALLSYWCIYGPLESAVRKEPRISLSIKGVIVSTALLVLGLLLTIFGKRAGTILYRSPRQLSGVGALCAVVNAGIGFLVYLCLKTVLERYGYTF